jgi:ankyrin repeat protein
MAEYLYFVSLRNLSVRFPAHDSFEDLRYEVTLVPHHDLVINNALEQLNMCLEQEPGIVLVQDTYGFTLLHWAALCSELDVVRAIINAGADVNAVSRNGCTVLMWAVEAANSAPLCKMLIEAGAKLELTDKAGLTALHRAFCMVSPETQTVEILLHAGADLNHTEISGLAIVPRAAFVASSDDLELLLGCGADVNATTPDGQRAIDFAIQQNNHDAITALLKHAASVDHHQEFDFRPYSWVIISAAAYGDLATMRLLTDARLTDIAMDHCAVDEYWFYFDNRSPPPYGKGDPLESLRSAFKALLASITPRETEQTSNKARRPLYNMGPMPGAFPIDAYGDFENEHSEDMSDDLEDADDDSGHVGTELQDTNNVASSLDMSPSVRSEVGANQQTEHIERPAARANANQHKAIQHSSTAL